MVTKQRRLTTCEARAQRWASNNREQGDTVFSIEWRKSKMWGHNPVIESHEGKMCNVSGCGYCKLSTALAEVLCFLFPVDSEEFNDIRSKGGTGENSVISTMKKHGWTLEKTASGKSFDVYTIRKDSK